jgi:hypothetical protein
MNVEVPPLTYLYAAAMESDHLDRSLARFPRSGVSLWKALVSRRLEIAACGSPSLWPKATSQARERTA